MNISDTVSLVIPLKAEYVSIVRLSASGIATRIGFDYDTIEDIKVAISEVLAKVIEKKTSGSQITIDFLHLKDGISIRFNLEDVELDNLFDEESDSFALAIIETLMDEVDFTKNSQNYMTMVKKLGKVV